ncbi:MlaD family protein [Prevotella sp. E15-22]|uniref:MlaD family protein n=1 Tax=Prevotella sp. E15-22 TaxID=2937774 RepID=UPI00205E6E65|nr:MlaD family protein [Prevotella sp. E15-22]UPS45013.1 MlaD family protein [Prevotella sp. E15-22]
MKYFTKEVKIALVAVAGIIILFFGMQFLKGLTIFSTDDSYYARFNDVSGLSASSPVYANGYRVGVVQRIEYDYSRPDNIVAVIGLDNQLSLPKGTRAEISSDLLGNVKLELKFGPNPIDLMAKGDTIEGGTASGLMGRAAQMIPQIEVMLPKLDSILASLNALMQDPAIKNSLHNVDDITANLSTTSKELNALSAQLNHQMPSMLAKTNGILTNVEGTTQKLNDIDLVATMQKVDRAMANVEQTTAKLNSNEGTLGLLMRDPELYNNMNATMQSADSLLMDMKQHPKRYVHFSVFGRKDK